MKERCYRGKDSSIHAIRQCTSSCYSYVDGGVVNLFLPSCPVCDQLQTFTEWLPGAVVWLQNRAGLILPHGDLTFNPNNPALKLFELIGNQLANSSRP